MDDEQQYRNSDGRVKKLLRQLAAILVLTLSLPIGLTIIALIWPRTIPIHTDLTNNVEVLTSYIGSLVSLVAIAVTLPAIFLDRDAKIEAVRRTFDQTVERNRFVRWLHALKNFITPPFVYIYSTISTVIIAGYLVPTPFWLCDGGIGLQCRTIRALKHHAPSITVFLLISTLVLVGVFIWLLIEHSKTKLLEDIKQACVRQGKEKNGYIDPDLIKLVGEVGHLCYRGKDKKSSIATIQAIVEQPIQLNHETMCSLAQAVTAAVGSGDKDNYQEALEVLQTIIKQAREAEEEQAYIVPRVWKTFTALLVDAIQLDVGLNLRTYLDEFKIDETQRAQGFGIISTRRLVEIGIAAIEENKPQLAYSAFIKLHGEAVTVVESGTWQINQEVIHQFFGFFAHLWAYDKASQSVLRPFIDGFMEVARMARETQSNGTLPVHIKSAKKFFAQMMERVITITKLEELLYAINQQNFVKLYLQDALGKDKCETYYERIVYHYPSVELLEKAHLYSIMACDVPKNVAQKIITA